MTEAQGVAAILHDREGRYLLQHRDDIDSIELPNYWGLFGGSIEPKENIDEAILRELSEELEFTPQTVSYFTAIVTDLNPIAGRTACKHFFDVPITTADVEAMILGEGQAFDFFTFAEVSTVDVVPGDVYALYLHSRRDPLAHDLVAKRDRQ